MAADVDIVIGAQDKASAVINDVAGKVGSFSVGILGKLNPALFAAATAVGGAVAAFVSLDLILTKVGESAGNIDELAKSARGIGSSVGDLQAMELALASIAGIEADKTVDTLKEMQKIIGETAAGESEERSNILKRLGLDAKTLSAQGPIEQFKQLQAAISSVSNTAERAAIADKLLGGTAVDLLPAMVADTKELNDALAQAGNLGLTLTDQQAAGVEAMNDAIAKASGSVDGLFNRLTAELAPAVTVVANAIVEWVPPLIQIADVYLPSIIDSLVASAGYAYDLGKILLGISTSNFKLLGEGIESMQNEGQTAIEWLNKVQEARNAAAQAAKENAEKMRDMAAASSPIDQSAIDAEKAKAAAVEKTIEALQRKLAVEKFGEDAVKRFDELKTATTTQERERIALLQKQIQAQEKINESIKDQKKAQEEAIKEREKEAKEREKGKESIREKASQFQPGVGAVESRLLTRGPAEKGIDKIAGLTEKSLQALHLIREALDKPSGSGLQLEYVP